MGSFMVVDPPKSPFMQAVEKVLTELDGLIPPSFTEVVDAYLVGGVAVHIHTAWRVSRDIDVKFSHRLLIREAPVVTYMDAGERKAVRLDTNYTDAIALVHPDWQDDAMECGKVGRIRMKVMTPTDLAVSKIGRFGDNDREDIRELARAGLLDADEVELRCNDALDYYIGDQTTIRYNLSDALEIIRQCTTTAKPR
jgi:hypothetical protein